MEPYTNYNFSFGDVATVFMSVALPTALGYLAAKDNQKG